MKTQNASSTAQPHATHIVRPTAPKILVLGALGVLLYVAHVAFIPVALALLFALVLSSPVEALHRLKVPRGAGAAIILIAVLALVAGTIDLMSAPAQQWFSSMPQTMPVIKKKVAPVAKFVSRIEDMVGDAGILRTGSRAAATPAAGAPTNDAPVVLFDATREAIASLSAFVIITLFLLAGGPPMLARMTAAFVDDLNAAHVLDIIEKVRGEVGRFYVATTLINVGLGLATAGAMTLCGMPTPYLWGIVAGTLNFIPYAGSATTLIVLSLVAVVSFDGVGHVMAVAGSYVALATIEGQLVQPLIVGHRLEVNPLLIFLALWFGGLFWGIAGIVLATPTLVALKVVAANARSGKSVIEFLGPNDQRPDDKRRVKTISRPLASATR